MLLPLRNPVTPAVLALLALGGGLSSHDAPGAPVSPDAPTAAPRAAIYLERVSRHHLSALALSPDGKTVAVLYRGTIHVFDTATRKRLATLHGHASFVRFSPDGKLLAAPNSVRERYRHTIRVWNLTTWEEEAPVTNLPLSFGKGLPAPRFWDVGVGRPFRAVVPDTEYQTTEIAFSPDGKVLARVERFRDGLEKPPPPQVTLWRAADGKHLTTLRGHDSTIDAVAWSPDGKTLATSGLTKVWKDNGPGSPREYVKSATSILLWDAATGKEIAKLDGHKDLAHALQFTPDGKVLVSCGRYDGALFWDVGLRKAIGRAPERPPACAIVVALSADGKTLAVGNTSNWVRVWDVASLRPKGR
jgi:WD40 repeat protein